MRHSILSLYFKHHLNFEIDGFLAKLFMCPITQMQFLLQSIEIIRKIRFFFNSRKHFEKLGGKDQS